MSIELLVPNLPESVADATLVAWHKEPGDIVRKDENLVDLETDKVVLEVPAPQSGILKQIKQQDGATVTSGDLLAIIDLGDGAEPVDAATVANEPEIPGEDNETAERNKSGGDDLPPLSPAVRRLVLEKNVDPSLVTGSGKDGRLTKTDVIDYLDGQATAENIQPKSAPSQPTPESKQQPPRIESREARPEQRVPMTRLRARVAERLIQAQQNAAMLTTFNEVDLSKVIELRGQHKDAFEKQFGIKLGFMSFFVKAAVEALKRFPIINASVDKQDIIYHGFYDIGIAVSSERGLVVPILRDADQLNFAEIEKSIAKFSKNARDGALSYDDLTGGTFTITNGGIFGSMMSTPILNPPQSAILGMHSITKRPVADKDQVVIRPMMYLALSYDHRIVDGREAVQFLVAIRETLEDPARLLLHL